MIKIRKATKKDLAAIADIWYKEERLSEKLESFYRLKKNAKKIIINKLKKKINKKDFIIFVAEDKGKIIASFQGWISKPYYLWDYDAIGHVGTVYVERAYRKKGIAKKLLDELIRWFKSKNVDAIDGYFLNKNKIAKKVWHKLGFKDVMVYCIKN